MYFRNASRYVESKPHNDNHMVLETEDIDIIDILTYLSSGIT